MKKEYEMECPNPECLTTLTLGMDPIKDDPEEDIECPECLEAFTWQYDAASDTVTLLPYEDDAEDEEEEDEEDELAADEDDDD